MLRRFFALALFAALAAGVSFAALADPAVAERSISIVVSEVPGSVKLVFGEASSQDTLYLHVGYGTTDGGDTPAGWERFVYVADITADMTEYECILPSGWGTKVKAVRYFLTTEKAPYDIAYEYIRFNGNNSNGSYFKTDYTPIPSKTHVVTDFTLKSTANMALFCSRGSTGTFTQFYISGTGFRFDCGPSTASKYQAAIAASQDTQYLVESGPNLKVSWEGGSETKEIPTLPEGTNFTAATVMYLFASHSDGSGFGNYANGEARSVRIYESDSGVYNKTTLVHEYIPVKNPATGVGALYDTVTHKFVPHTTSDDSKGCVYVNEQQASYEYETAGSSDTLAYVPRTLEVVSVASAGGTTKVTLAVSAGDVVGAAVAVGLGDYDYGVEFSDWPTNEILSVVSSSAQQIEVGMPSCWNTAAYSSARFFLVHCSPITLQVMESVKGDGGATGAYIDLGRKGVLGDMVQITARACGKGALFGARESATENCFSVKSESAGGSHDLYLDYSDYECSRGNYSRPDTQDWITFLNSPTERCVYSGTDTSGAAVPHGAHWNDYPHYGDMVTKDFTTPVNLRLFDAYQVDTPTTVNRFNESVKCFYLWHIDGGTTNLVMDLIPVRKEATQEAGFYDLVSKKLFTNAAGTGAFTAEGQIQDVIVCPTEVLPESEAQTVTAPVFASRIRASVAGDNVNIEVSVPNDQKWCVYAVYGDEDKGLDPTAWGANVVTIENGSGTGPGSVVWTPPARWRKTMKVIRFFLSSAAPMTTYEYLKGDGKAYIDLERKGVFGDMVAFKCRLNASAAGGFAIFGARRPNTEGAEKDNFSIQGNGNMNLDYSDYRVSRAIGKIDAADTTSWLSFISTPTLRQVWQNGVSKGKDEQGVTTAFETADNLYLFNVGGYNGNVLNGCIKDFELRHVEGSVTNDVMRLVPVVAEDGTCGMYDKVRMKFLKNAASTGSFSVTGAAATGTCVDPGYKMSGVSDSVNRGGLILMVR